MLSSLIAPLRRFAQVLLANGAPSELAAGFTLGLMIGLVPKGNLIALSLCVLLFSLRVNRGLGLASAVFFSSVAHWVDPFAHKLGLIALSAEPLQASYASICSLPLGPWIGFDNTVVAGTLLVGLYVAYPVFYVSRAAIAWLQPRGAEWLRRRRSELWLSDGSKDTWPGAA